MIVLLIGGLVACAAPVSAQGESGGIGGTGVTSGEETGGIGGTGIGGDRWAMHDAGAAMALDFSDAGHPSTFGVALPRLTQVLGLPFGHLAAHDVGAIVLELADGLFQPGHWQVSRPWRTGSGRARLRAHFGIMAERLGVGWPDRV